MALSGLRVPGFLDAFIAGAEWLFYFTGKGKSHGAVR